MNNTYCAAPFNHIYVDTSSRYRLCCDAAPFKNSARSASAAHLLPFDYLFSPKMDSIRNKMLEKKYQSVSIVMILKKKAYHLLVSGDLTGTKLETLKDLFLLKSKHAQ